jgi:nucleoside-diphosphate-sugar epimerase
VDCDPRFLNSNFLSKRIAIPTEAPLTHLFYVASTSLNGNSELQGLEASLHFADLHSARTILVSTNPLSSQERQLLETRVHTHNLKYRTRHGALRCANPYGPRMNSSDAAGLLSFLTQALRGEAISQGSEFSALNRSLCYVSDAVEGILRYARDRRLVEVQTICGDRLYGASEILSVCADLLDSKLSFESLQTRQGFRSAMLPAHKAARELLSWELRVDLRTGMAKVLHWMRSEMSTSFNRSRKLATVSAGAVAAPGAHRDSLTGSRIVSLLAAKAVHN